MKRIFLSLIFALIILTSVSLVCASDVDNVTNDFQGDKVIISPELDGFNVDNYQFEGNYSTQEDIDGCLPINITDDLNDTGFNDTECEYEPCTAPMFNVVDYNISRGVINLTLLVTNPDTGKGLADLPIILDYGCGATFRPFNSRPSYTDADKHAIIEILKINNGRTSIAESIESGVLEKLKLANGTTDENGYVTFSVPFVDQFYFEFLSSYGKFIFNVPPSAFMIHEENIWEEC